ASPAGLVRGPQACSGVCVEVLVERDQAVPGGVDLELLVGAEDRPPAVLIKKERCQPALELVRHGGKGQLAARAGRALDPVVVAQVRVEAPEAGAYQVIDREPDRPSPVGVATKKP